MTTMRTSAVIAAGLLLGLASPSLARQSMGFDTGDENPNPATQTQDVRPPAPTDPGKPSIVGPYLLMFVLVGAAIGLAVMPSGRTHQD